MAILGYSTLGGQKHQCVNGRKYVSHFTPTESGTITELHFWFTADSPGHNSTFAICAYRDTGAGAPGARLGFTTVQTIIGGTGDQDVAVTGLSIPFALANGDVWLGFACSNDSFGGTDGFRFDDFAAGSFQGVTSGAANNPPSDPFGTIDASGTRRFSVWAVYTPAILTPAVNPVQPTRRRSNSVSW